MSIKSIASIFADIIFKPKEFSANDMGMGKMFTELLSLMIKENHKIFGRDNSKSCDLSASNRIEVITVFTDELISKQGDKFSITT